MLLYISGESKNWLVITEKCGIRNAGMKVTERMKDCGHTKGWISKFRDAAYPHVRS